MTQFLGNDYRSRRTSRNNLRGGEDFAPATRPLLRSKQFHEAVLAAHGTDTAGLPTTVRRRYTSKESVRVGDLWLGFAIYHPNLRELFQHVCNITQRHVPIE